MATRGLVTWFCHVVLSRGFVTYLHYKHKRRGQHTNGETDANHEAAVGELLLQLVVVSVESFESICTCTQV